MAVREGRGLREIPVNTTYIVDYSIYVTKYFVEKNFCTLNGKLFSTFAIAIVTNFDETISDSESRNYEFLAGLVLSYQKND